MSRYAMIFLNYIIDKSNKLANANLWWHKISYIQRLNTLQTDICTQGPISLSYNSHILDSKFSPGTNSHQRGGQKFIPFSATTFLRWVGKLVQVLWGARRGPHMMQP